MKCYWTLDDVPCEEEVVEDRIYCAKHLEELRKLSHRIILPRECEKKPLWDELQHGIYKPCPKKLGVD